MGAAHDGTLPSSSFEASSFFAGTDAFEGRLHGPDAWCATDNSNEYLTVDIGSVARVCSVATQGYDFGFYWVTRYQLQYSNDGINWKTVEKVFLFLLELFC